MLFSCVKSFFTAWPHCLQCRAILFVCLSVKRWYYTQMNEERIMWSSLWASQNTQFSDTNNGWGRHPLPQSSWIGSRLRAFQRAIDEVRTLPLTPSKTNSKGEFKNNFPYISVIDEASDFKFGMQLQFAKWVWPWARRAPRNLALPV